MVQVFNLTLDLMSEIKFDNSLLHIKKIDKSEILNLIFKRIEFK